MARNAPLIEAGATVITALVAVAALIGVKIQIDETDRLQKAQSAREAYRAHLALAATLPDFAHPADACHLIASKRGGAYVAFVDHLLYSAEQMLSVSEGWEKTFITQLHDHRDYLCAVVGPDGENEDTARLLSSYRESNCPPEPTCE